jgi:flavin reductase (DIM6/NTAB) family NADH-FMN oxidoreductase RutF
MTLDARNLPGEQLRQVMRRWVAGVTIVTSQAGERRHGMTVNSFTSLSLDPPLVSVTLASNTRTHALVQDSGRFGVTILSQEQAHLSDIFAGKVPDGGDRFEGVEVFHLSEHLPLIQNGLASLDCKVVHIHPLGNSTLFIGSVEAAWHREDGEPLIYYNRTYRRMEA